MAIYMYPYTCAIVSCKINLSMKLLIYKFIHRYLMYIWLTYLGSSYSVVWRLNTITPISNYLKKILFFILSTFMIILLPFTLMLCKSLIFDLIVTKFGTLIHLFMVYSSNTVLSILCGIFYTGDWKLSYLLSPSYDSLNI